MMQVITFSIYANESASVKRCSLQYKADISETSKYIIVFICVVLCCSVFKHTVPIAITVFIIIKRQEDG